MAIGSYFQFDDENMIKYIYSDNHHKRNGIHTDSYISWKIMQWFNLILDTHLIECTWEVFENSNAFRYVCIMMVIRQCKVQTDLTIGPYCIWLFVHIIKLRRNKTQLSQDIYKICYGVNRLKYLCEIWPIQSVYWRLCMVVVTRDSPAHWATIRQSFDQGPHWNGQWD